MKTLIPIILLSLFVSCTTRREAAYKTLAITAHSVDTALKAYADARVAGKVSDATHARVSEIKLRYEKAFLAAATAAQANLDSPSPADLITVANELLEIINVATKK
jgi:hypothetical protein